METILQPGNGLGVGADRADGTVLMPADPLLPPITRKLSVPTGVYSYVRDVKTKASLCDLFWR